MKPIPRQTDHDKPSLVLIAFTTGFSQSCRTGVSGAIWIIEEEGRMETGDLLLHYLRPVCLRISLTDAVRLLEKGGNRPAIIFLERFPGKKTTRDIVSIKELYPGGKVILISNWGDPEEMSRQFSRALVKDLRPGAPPLPRQNNYQLSKRELEILKCMVNGLIKKEIAERLSISYHTVDNHQRNIFRKLNVHTRSAAVAKALLEKLF